LSDALRGRKVERRIPVDEGWRNREHELGFRPEHVCI
jgi:hypothetical protein